MPSAALNPRGCPERTKVRFSDSKVQATFRRFAALLVSVSAPLNIDVSAIPVHMAGLGLVNYFGATASLEVTPYLVVTLLIPTRSHIVDRVQRFLLACNGVKIVAISLSVR